MDDTFFKEEQKKKKLSPSGQGMTIGDQPAAPLVNPNSQMTGQRGGASPNQSTGQAGTGFVNLSHMLDLNKASGQKSANQLGKSVSDAGAKAQAGLGTMMNDFNTKAMGAAMDANKMMTYDAEGNPNYAGGTPGINQGIANSQMAYSGPSSLSEMKGYGDLQKSLLGTAGTAANLAKGGQGIAAEVGKTANLSPAQAAASAFYMGVNNKNLRGVGQGYKGLGDTLDAANTESIKTAQLAKQRHADAAGQLTEYGKKMDARWKTIDENEAKSKAIKELEDKRAADEALHPEDEAAKNATKGRGQEKEVTSISDETWAIQHGVPPEMAHQGVTYEDWQAAGQPADMDAYLAWKTGQGK